MTEPSRRRPGFARRVVTVAAGSSRPYDASEWRGAIVIVEYGEVELETVAGARHRFRRGDILWLDGLGVRVLNNHGREPAVLLAISRRHDDS